MAEPFGGAIACVGLSTCWFQYMSFHSFGYTIKDVKYSELNVNEIFFAVQFVFKVSNTRAPLNIVVNGL